MHANVLHDRPSQLQQSAVLQEPSHIHCLPCWCSADASAKLYRPHAYYAAKVAATTPFQIISALVFCFTVYGMAGLRPGPQFIWENGIISTLLSLIAVQVSKRTRASRQWHAHSSLAMQSKRKGCGLLFIACWAACCGWFAVSIC